MAESTNLSLLENKSKKLINNQKLSDVMFQIDGKIIYGHTFMLAMNSPVFEKMFYGDLKESNTRRNQNEPIKILDITSIGFLNMLNFFYGYKIEDFLELNEINETYRAADKYMVDDLKEQLSEYIKQKLNIDNCCLIYDQLIKTQSEDILSIDKVRSLVQLNTKQTFENEYFTKISLNTLIDLLTLDYLVINEIDVIKSCVRWVEEEVKRSNLESTRENKQKIFEQIKNLIKFENLTLEQMNGFSEIDNLLNREDVGTLFLQLINKSKDSIFKCKTQRKTAQSHKHVYSNTYPNDSSWSKFTALLSISKHCLIKCIYSTIHIDNGQLKNLKLTIFNNEKQNEIDYDIKLINHYWCFDFKTPVELKPQIDYKLTISFDQEYFWCYYRPEPQSKIHIGKETIELNLNYENYFCLDTIDFLFFL